MVVISENGYAILIHILDESGSMHSIKRPTISGFNEVIQTTKQTAKNFPEQEHFISFVTFNGTGIRTIHHCEEVEKIKEIDEKSFNPRASTPLYDAMGISITALRRTTDKETNTSVLVTILTDGEENTSTEYSGQDIKKLVEELKTKNWTFTYIGANHDVEDFAEHISIDNSMRYEANEEDMKVMFQKEMYARERYFDRIKRKENLSRRGFYDEEENEEQEKESFLKRLFGKNSK